jgi:hypothetical protein
MTLRRIFEQRWSVTALQRYSVASVPKIFVSHAT